MHSSNTCIHLSNLIQHYYWIWSWFFKLIQATMHLYHISSSWIISTLHPACGPEFRTDTFLQCENGCSSLKWLNQKKSNLNLHSVLASGHVCTAPTNFTFEKLVIFLPFWQEHKICWARYWSKTRPYLQNLQSVGFWNGFKFWIEMECMAMCDGYLLWLKLGEAGLLGDSLDDQNLTLLFLKNIWHASKGKKISSAASRIKQNRMNRSGPSCSLLEHASKAFIRSTRIFAADGDARVPDWLTSHPWW